MSSLQLSPLGLLSSSNASLIQWKRGEAQVNNSKGDLFSEFRNPWPQPRGESPSTVLEEKAQRRWRMSAAASSFVSPSSGVPKLNIAYKRVADCLVFPALPRRRKPRALIHFIGGAFIGAVPEVTYSLFIELLTRQDFLVIATPYNVTFEHVVAAETVHRKFQNCREALVNGGFSLGGLNPEDVARLPVFSIGHSNGALLQLLIGCIIQEGLPKANAVIAFNNKPAADAVPYFEQLGPVTVQLAPIIATSPLLNLSRSFPESLKGLLDAASPIFPQYDKESLQSLQNFMEQIPLVLDQVTRGISEFTPAPLENRKTIGSEYSVQDTLLVKYKVDAIDESDVVEDVLKSRIQNLGGSLTKIMVNGNHITPCVQDIKWEAGKVYTPFDATGQVFRNIALSEIRETVASVSGWFETFL